MSGKTHVEFDGSFWRVYDEKGRCLFVGTQQEVEEWLDWRDYWIRNKAG